MKIDCPALGCVSHPRSRRRLPHTRPRSYTNGPLVSPWLLLGVCRPLSLPSSSSDLAPLLMVVCRRVQLTHGETFTAQVAIGLLGRGRGHMRQCRYGTNVARPTERPDGDVMRRLLGLWAIIHTPPTAAGDPVSADEELIQRLPSRSHVSPGLRLGKRKCH